MKQETINKILEYFKQNEDVFEQCIEELDSYNGFLGDGRYYGMDMLNEFYSGVAPTEILAMAFYGRDDDTYTTDSQGNKTHGEFNPNRDYFYCNGSGNWVSSDYKDYSAYIDGDTVQEMSDCRSYIYTIDDDCDLAELFDELEREEDIE